MSHAVVKNSPNMRVFDPSPMFIHSRETFSHCTLAVSLSIFSHSRSHIGDFTPSVRQNSCSHSPHKNRDIHSCCQKLIALRVVLQRRESCCYATSIHKGHMLWMTAIYTGNSLGTRGQISTPKRVALGNIFTPLFNNNNKKKNSVWKRHAYPIWVKYSRLKWQIIAGRMVILVLYMKSADIETRANNRIIRQINTCVYPINKNMF